MQIVQRKSKDAEIAESVFVELQSVAIPGWRDEDNQPVTSAVVVEAQAPVAPRKESKLDSHRKLFENGWWASGAETRDGLPYLSRSALKDKLAADGRKPRTVENDLSPSYPDKLIGSLIQAEIISPYEHGWVVIEDAQASAMLIRKGGE